MSVFKDDQTTYTGNLTVLGGLSVGVIGGGVGPVVSPSPHTNSLGSDVLLNNTAIYFDGPSVAQGSTGTWFASGTVTLIDTAAVGAFFCVLWDGTNIIATAGTASAAANSAIAVSLSGYLANPAGNLRISARDSSATTGKILFNISGNSKDSTISAMRIA